jgi:hypothetical protein
LLFPCKFYFPAHFLAKAKISFCKEISLQMEALVQSLLHILIGIQKLINIHAQIV